MMKKSALVAAAAACAAMAFAPISSADPTAGHSTIVHIQSPPMLCQIGSDDADAAVGPNVVCQGAFPQAPLDPPWPGWKGDPSTLRQHQAVVTASGEFSYRDANISVGGPHPPFGTLSPGQTYHIQGWLRYRGVSIQRQLVPSRHNRIAPSGTPGAPRGRLPGCSSSARRYSPA
jgi:hypothetical protein